MRSEVTVIIPAHLARVRNGMLGRAIGSVLAQTVVPDDILIGIDTEKAGAAATRNDLLDRVQTEWVAFLDSDDEFDPNHLEVLLDHLDTQTDVLYSGCRVVGPDGQTVPLQEEWGRFSKPFDADLLRQKSYIPVTSLVRWSSIGRGDAFIRPPGSPHEDWGFYLRLLERGAQFKHVPVVTWTWHHHGRNSSGDPWKGDAA